MSKIRTFIAFPIPSDVRDVLAKTIERLAEQIPDRSVRWVKPDLMHLTMRFLGDTEESTLAILNTLLDGIGSRHEAREFKLDKLGCFPNCKRPRVIWAGMDGDESGLANLKKDLDEKLSGLGWQPENKPFRAHITIGRVKNQLNLNPTIWNENLEKRSLLFSELHLIESKLTPQGPIYTTRHISRLQQHI